VRRSDRFADRPYADMVVFKQHGKCWLRLHGREAGPCASKARAVTPAVSAFLSLQTGSTRATKERDVRAMRRNKSHLENAQYGSKDVPPTADEITTAEARRDRLSRSAQIWRWAGIFAVLVSCGAFIAGATIGATNLLNFEAV
jgi:hypothetical protein